MIQRIDASRNIGLINSSECLTPHLLQMDSAYLHACYRAEKVAVL